MVLYRAALEEDGPPHLLVRADAGGWTCGMGYYMPKPLTMAKLRARIDRDPAAMEKLMRS